MEAITQRTRLGPRGATLVCPCCQAQGPHIACMQDVRNRKYECLQCERWLPLLNWLLRRC
jgi:hypothetical protein